MVSLEAYKAVRLTDLRDSSTVPTRVGERRAVSWTQETS